MSKTILAPARDTFNLNDIDHQQQNNESFDYEFNAGEDMLVDMSVTNDDMSALKITQELAGAEGG
jgi:hypothetical protein